MPDLLAAHPERLARFEREAQLLASLNHPHIAQIYGFEDSSPGRGSWLAARGSRLVARGSWLVANHEIDVGPARQVRMHVVEVFQIDWPHSSVDFPGPGSTST